MKEKLKRSLGLLLALVMVASMFPVSVFAEEAEPISTEDVSVIVADEEASVVEQVTSFVSNVIGPLQLEEMPAVKGIIFAYDSDRLHAGHPRKNKLAFSANCITIEVDLF